MTQEVTTNNLKINVLTREQYDSIETPSTNELYFIEESNKTEFLRTVNSTAPINPQLNDRYFNTTDKMIYTWDGSSWTNGITPTEDSLYIALDKSYTYVWHDGNLIQVGGALGADGVDGQTIIVEGEKLRAIGLLNKNGLTPMYNWVGTKVQYQSLGTYNENWIYYITDDVVPNENMSFTNVLNRLNKAWGWTYTVGTTEYNVWTVPLPEVNYHTYSDVDLTERSTIHSMTATTITDGYYTYTRNSEIDSIFTDACEDSKNQIVSMYDLIKAIRG